MIFYTRPFFHNNISKVNKQGLLKGYASYFNCVDQHKDCILPGAFSYSLYKNFLKLKSMPMLWEHNPDLIIGQWNHVAENENGLIVEGQLDLESSLGNFINKHVSFKIITNKSEKTLSFNQLKNRKIRGLSIGCELAEFYLHKGVRFITRLNLKEISLVQYPANHKAVITQYKSL